MQNEYSSQWFKLFCGDRHDQTQKELEFITQFIPIAKNKKKILDIACGTGRIAIPLSKMGYDVLGVDINDNALSIARNSSSDVSFLQLDMVNIDELAQKFHGIILIWQSWGYHDGNTNRDILKKIRNLLHEGGIFIIDIYNKDFFQSKTGLIQFEKMGISIEEEKSIENDRLNVTLSYSAGRRRDHFNWEIFSPDDFSAIVMDIGYKVLAKTSGFDKTQPPIPNQARMQFVLSKMKV